MISWLVEVAGVFVGWCHWCHPCYWCHESWLLMMWLVRLASWLLDWLADGHLFLFLSGWAKLFPEQRLTLIDGCKNCRVYIGVVIREAKITYIYTWYTNMWQLSGKEWRLEGWTCWYWVSNTVFSLFVPWKICTDRQGAQHAYSLLWGEGYNVI